MQAAELIERFSPGFNNLSSAEKEAIQTFTLMWTLFEAQILGTNASAQKIKESTKKWNESGDLKDSGWYQEQLDYFIARYVDAGDTNDRFNHLELRANDDLGLVSSVLKGVNKNHVDQLTAILIIVLRFRNNFFHGIKWAYGMQGQQKNFEHSIELLKNCLDKFK
ncbi:MAG: hypothetical protein JWQ21_4010 [Herminiimonas sp.]|nr:hypothetical protein [Herminiimonas sp.]